LFAGGLHRAQVAAARAAWEQSVDKYRLIVPEGSNRSRMSVVTLRVLEQQSTVEANSYWPHREAEKLTLSQYRPGTVP